MNCIVVVCCDWVALFVRAWHSYNKVGLDGELKVPTIGRRYSVAAGWEAKIAATQSLWFHAVMDWIDEHRDPGSRRYRRDRHSGPDPTGKPPMREYLPTSGAAA